VAHEYLTPARDQQFLLPVSMREWLAEGHLAWFVIDVVSQLDCSQLHKRHPNDGPGRPAYDPEMMCALLIYAYASGVRSSRRIEAACRTDAAFRVICGGLVPDHATIARFIVNQEQALEKLFVQGLRLCHAAGLLDLSVLALDGTKMAADAALDQNRSAEWIRRQIQALMAETVTSEQVEAPAPSPLEGFEGLEPVAEISTPSGRLARLKAALAVIEAQEAKHKAEAQTKAKAAFEEAEQGRKLRGRKPKDPAARLARAQADLAAARQRATAKQARRQASNGREQQLEDPADDAVKEAEAQLAAAHKAAAEQPAKPSQANITDPDSRIMKTQKSWLQGYNAQAIVNKHQIVLATTVSHDANDLELYQPMLDELKQTLADAGIPAELVELMLADAGYCSEENLTAPGPDRLIATQKDHKQRRAARELGTTTGPPPQDASPLEAMEHRLRTTDGAAAYAHRGHLIEPVFGDRKENRGYRAFRRRGLSAATSEWAFMHLVGNLTKLYRHQRAACA
jgi:transposase